MFQFIENGWLSATVGFTYGKPSILRIEGPQINETSPKKTTQEHFQTWLTRNLNKRSQNYHKRTPKSRKDTKNNDIKTTRKVDGKMELGSAMEGGRVPEDSRGPWAQYMYRSAPCLPARQVRARWQQEILGLCFLVVCRVFVFCRMFDARGNLDLESPEELLTSSSATPGPGPSGPIAFWRLIFASFFVMFFCIVFSCLFDGFRSPFWLHVGIIFHVFCITFSSIDFRWNCHQFCKDFHVIFEVLLLISMVLHPIGESLKNIGFYVTLVQFTLSQTHVF